MNPSDKKRIEKLEREYAKLRKILPKQTPPTAIKNPPVIIHKSPIKKIDQRKFK